MQTDVRSVRAPEESARAFVYRVLSTYIKEMFLHPGEKLAETDVAAELQVSRTPVHDTFSRLEREKMLRPVPRGAVVPPLNTDMIRQTVWMHRTVSQAVLGELYNHRPTTLEPLDIVWRPSWKPCRAAPSSKWHACIWSSTAPCTLWQGVSLSWMYWSATAAICTGCSA